MKVELEKWFQKDRKINTAGSRVGFLVGVARGGLVLARGIANAYLDGHALQKRARGV